MVVALLKHLSVQGDPKSKPLSSIIKS